MLDALRGETGITVFGRTIADKALALRVDLIQSTRCFWSTASASVQLMASSATRTFSWTGWPA